MNSCDIQIEKNQVHKLLCAANGDAALLYLYINSGNDPESAMAALQMNQTRYSCASAILRQMGMWPQKKQILMVGERPRYTEEDVIRADGEMDFRHLRGEVERLMGKSMTTEELKILLGFVRYLGLSAEVVCMLVSYCRERSRQKGSTRAPSLRTIEKEAYSWAEQGIDTMEEAAVFIRNQNVRQSRMGRLMQLLQIRGRNLTSGEEKYAQKWLDMGMSEELIAMAYERTCLNTGGLNWAYMNKIMTRWNENGIHTPEQVTAGDKKPVPKGASGQLGDAEMEAIQKLLREG